MARSSPQQFAWDPSINLGGTGKSIDARDALRQTFTAQGILERLREQPGLILADEVGLGKTFVALAVAASVATSTRKRHPVVVMVPPALTEKWPDEWETFQQQCLPAGHGLRATTNTISTPAAFLQQFDDDARTRNHIVFVAHGALTRQNRDRFTRLAIIRAAFYKTSSLARQRSVFPRWARQLLDYAFDEDTARALLAAPLTHWRDIWNDYKPNQAVNDDPVFLQLTDMIRDSAVDLRPLRDELRRLPLNTTGNLKDRLAAAKPGLMAAIQDVWDQALSHADFASPLLILDEAHHVKNDGKIAGLFTSPEAIEDAEQVSTGALAGKFDRMLFLTATPFQLGHRELIRVLSRFDGVRWPSVASRQEFAQQRAALSTSLDEFQSMAHRLDFTWSKLQLDDVDQLPERWWDSDTQDPAILASNSRLVSALSALGDLQSQCEHTASRLQPWVIRHVRLDRDDRRHYQPGDLIRPDGSAGAGLEISPEALLPFLVAARARTIIADRRITQGNARAYFADGLASSFEAYRDTRRNREGFTDEDNDASTRDTPQDLEWYLRWIEKSLPKETTGDIPLHPKVAATVARTLDAWQRGEKVLIFCFFIETGRALRREISAALERSIFATAAGLIGVDTTDGAAITAGIERVARRLDADTGTRRELDNQLRILSTGSVLTDDQIQQFIDVVVGFLRTDAFIVRYVLPQGQHPEAMLEALDVSDATGTTLRARLRGFLERMGDLPDKRRDATLAALSDIKTGRYATREDDDGERSTVMVLPNVRLANGRTKATQKNTLVATFNMPFFPEVLIASPVLSEGVDLHWECRTVIHHDLDWNPSALEQRNGRLDRLRSRSEQLGIPIDIYEPYTTGLQDEKMYKVVSDRARWFNIVMGDKVDMSEAGTEAISERVPLPPELARTLALDLRVFKD